jgi:PTS system nitrogen regulatory IIA component
MKITELLTPERMLPRLRARDRTTALRQLSAVIARDASVSEDVILKHIVVAADLPPYMPHGGVSLLHTLVSDMKHPMAALGRLDPPLDFGAPDGYPTDIAVLLASPTTQPQDHLRALACIARQLRREDVRELVRAASSRDAIFVAFTVDEWSPARFQDSARRLLRAQNRIWHSQMLQ